MSSCALTGETCMAVMERLVIIRNWQALASLFARSASCGACYLTKMQPCITSLARCSERQNEGQNE